MSLFERASKKLGLDQAVLNGFEAGKSGEGSLSKKEVEQLLRQGAYNVFTEEKEGTAEAESKAFLEQDIDTILQRRARTVVYENTGSKSKAAGGAFSKARFTAAKSPDGKTTHDVDIADPDFWRKMVGEGEDDQDEKENLPAKRSRAKRNYAETNAPLDSDDDGNDSDNDDAGVHDDDDDFDEEDAEESDSDDDILDVEILEGPTAAARPMQQQTSPQPVGIEAANASQPAQLQHQRPQTAGQLYPAYQNMMLQQAHRAQQEARARHDLVAAATQYGLAQMVAQQHAAAQQQLARVRAQHVHALASAAQPGMVSGLGNPSSATSFPGQERQHRRPNGSS